MAVFFLWSRVHWLSVWFFLSIHVLILISLSVSMVESSSSSSSSSLNERPQPTSKTHQHFDNNPLTSLDNDALLLSSSDSPKRIIRLFLVRHGETQANVQHLVAGQTESPLTDQGKAQARALGREAWFRQVAFDRIYVSDMGRTQETAQHMLGVDRLEDVSPQLLRLEPRLREVAKGAREKQPKHLSYQQALETLPPDQPVPKLEDESQVWDRLEDWLQNHVLPLPQQQEQEKEATTTLNHHPKNVLVVSHSGTIRTLLCRLVPQELPSDVDVSALNFQNTAVKRLQIPNTSVSVVDLVAVIDDDPTSNNNDKQHTTEYKSHLRILTWTGHMAPII